MGPDDLGALTTHPVSGAGDVPSEARARFVRARRDFTDTERRALEAACARVRARSGAGASILTERPWKFLKTAAGTAEDLPYTRGTGIVFSERGLGMIVMYEEALAAMPDESRASAEAAWMNAVGTILLHEQLHVLQRTRPEIFESLYAKWGFERVAPVAFTDAATSRLTNPDAPLQDRVWRDANGGRWVFAMRLRRPGERPRLSRDMAVLAGPVTKTGDLYAGSGDVVPVSRVPGFKARFPLPDHSCDHPNEIAAYLLPQALEKLRGESLVPESGALAELISFLREAR